MNMEEEDAYRYAMLNLADAMPVWPPSQEQSDAARKCKLASHLAVLAQRLTHLHRPVSYPLINQKGILQQFSEGKLVLKREQSACSDHVLLPSKINAEVLKSCLNDHHEWLVQEYIPLLRVIGEWRAIVLGERVSYVIFTHPEGNGDLDFCRAKHFKCLHDMWWVRAYFLTTVKLTWLQETIPTGQEL